MLHCFLMKHTSVVCNWWAVSCKSSWFLLFFCPSKEEPRPHTTFEGWLQTLLSTAEDPSLREIINRFIIKVHDRLMHFEYKHWTRWKRDLIPIALRRSGHSGPCVTARLKLEKWDVCGRCRSIWLLKTYRHGEHGEQSGLDILWGIPRFVERRNAAERWDRSSRLWQGKPRSSVHN